MKKKPLQLLLQHPIHSGESVIYDGRIKDFQGRPAHGIYQRYYSKTVDIVVCNEGNRMNTYKHLKIDAVFHSRMVNWENLHLCGGWNMPGVKPIVAIERVLSGLKPMGTYIDTDMETIQFWAYQIALREDISCLVIEDWVVANNTLLIAASDKTFVEMFKLGDLSTDYGNYFASDPYLDIDSADIISELKDRRISEFMNPHTFDWSNATGLKDALITGLIFGYPVETTIACINGDVK